MNEKEGNDKKDTPDLDVRRDVLGAEHRSHQPFVLRDKKFRE
jgi:hypothetical protein